MKTTIKKWGINGEGIGYIGKKPVFIENTIPSEVVGFHITKEEKHYCIGKLEEIFTPSSSRRYPFCPIWQECGGCPSMHVKYKGQAKMKQTLIKQALKKYANYTGKIEPIIKNENPLGYRNSCKLPLQKVDGKWIAGMYQRDSHNFVGIKRCYVHTKILEQVRQEVIRILNEYEVEGCYSLVMKEFQGRVQIIIVTGKVELPKDLIQEWSALELVVSIVQNIKEENNHDLFGKQFYPLFGEQIMSLEINGLNLELLPTSFFQLNTLQAQKMYQWVHNHVESSNTIVEAYCGIGAIGLGVSSKACKLIGIEYNPEAVENAQRNAQKNGINNATFIAGDAGTVLEELSIPIDTLIVDPPRSGLDETMIAAILQKEPKHIIYVSCNPSTLSKNVSVLQKKYSIEVVQPFDIFSQTALVECAVVLRKKNG